MRGIVYRRVRRRTGSILLVVGGVLVFALSACAMAAARAPHAPQAAHASQVAHPVARAPKTMAHATGHKIA